MLGISPRVTIRVSRPSRVDQETQMHIADDFKHSGSLPGRGKQQWMHTFCLASQIHYTLDSVGVLWESSGAGRFQSTPSPSPSGSSYSSASVAFNTTARRAEIR